MPRAPVIAISSEDPSTRRRCRRRASNAQIRSRMIFDHDVRAATYDLAVCRRQNRWMAASNVIGDLDHQGFWSPDLRDWIEMDALRRMVEAMDAAPDLSASRSNHRSPACAVSPGDALLIYC